MINNNFSCDIGQISTDPDGNFVIVEIKTMEEIITLASIYGPNDDNHKFYRNLRQKIAEFGNNKVIICGDWNLVLNPEEDTENYRHVNNPAARQEVLKFIDRDNYIDIFRLFKDEKGFTWRRLNPEKQARLDYFLISEETFEIANDCNTLSGYRTDHSAITLQLKLNKNQRGRSYWKFNNSLPTEKTIIPHTCKIKRMLIKTKSYMNLNATKRPFGHFAVNVGKQRDGMQIIKYVFSE